MKYLTSSLVISLVAAGVPFAVCAETLTLCSEKVDYQPTISNPSIPSARDLTGVWVGEILGFSVPYGVDYRRCWALIIESVGIDGAVKAKIVLANSTKNMQTGASYGTKGWVISYTGRLGGNDKTLRLDDGKSVYDLQLLGAKMEGRVSYDSGYGRLFLTKQR
jgi:hypothetical protein